MRDSKCEITLIFSNRICAIFNRPWMTTLDNYTTTIYCMISCQEFRMMSIKAFLVWNKIGIWLCRTSSTSKNTTCHTKTWFKSMYSSNVSNNICKSWTSEGLTKKAVNQVRHNDNHTAVAIHQFIDSWERLKNVLSDTSMCAVLIYFALQLSVFYYLVYEIACPGF